MSKIIKPLVLISLLFSFQLVNAKDVLTAYLQTEISLSAPPKSVTAITSIDQSLLSGQIIPKGTRLVGNLTKSENGFVIDYELVKLNPEEKVIAKTFLSEDGKSLHGGLSAKVGDSFNENTKTSVLGAIFHTNTRTSKGIIKRGTKLIVEIE